MCSEPRWLCDVRTVARSHLFEVSRTANTLLAQLLQQQLELNSCVFCRTGKFRGREVKAAFESVCLVMHSYYSHLHYTTYVNLDDWLTVHHSITLVDLQLDAQNSCLFIYNTFIKILYMFRALPSSSSGGLRLNYIYAASGILTLCRWLSYAPVKKVLS